MEAKSSLPGTNNLMADNNPNIPASPAGAVPPKPPEAAKVQPKKETVRISLPPKPTSSPTIKLPTLPAGGPPPPPAPAIGVPPAAAAAPRPPVPPAAGAAPVSVRPPTASGAPAQRPPSAAAPAPAPAVRPAAPSAAAARKVSGLDVGLSIAAAVIGLGAVASVLLLLNLT